MKNIICMVNLGTGVGGLETLILRKAKWYVKNNYDVILLSTFKGEMHNEMDHAGIKILYVFMPLNSNMNRSQFLSLVNAYYKLILEYARSIVFVETFSPLTAAVGEHLAARLHIPSVAGVFHPQGYFASTTGKDWSALMRSYDQRNALYFMNEECKISHEKYYRTVYKTAIIPLPIEAIKNVYVANKNRFNLLSIGRLVDFKTYNIYMLDVIKQLRMELPDIKYTIIGDGPLFEQINEKIDSYHLRDCVELIKRVDYEKIETLIPNYDLHIGMGTSMLDVAKYGLPSLVAVPFSANGLTTGYLYSLRPYCVGEVDNIGTHIHVIEAIRHYLLSEDRLDISRKTFDYIKKYYDIDTVMRDFMQYANNASIPVQDENVILDGEGIKSFQVMYYKVINYLPSLRPLANFIKSLRK